MGHPGSSVALYCLPNRLLLLAVVATPTHSLNNATATTTLPPGFTQHAQFTGIGGLLTTLVGPGPTPGSERLYASHIYGGIALQRRRRRWRRVGHRSEWPLAQLAAG